MLRCKSLSVELDIQMFCESVSWARDPYTGINKSQNERNNDVSGIWLSSAISVYQMFS